VAIHEITRHHSGNSKLIKGKLFDSPGPGRFAGFSASGQDVWLDSFDREGDAIIVSAVGARCGKCFIARGKWSAVANTHVVWPDEEKVDLKYLWYLLNDEGFWVRSGSAQPFVATRKTFEKEIPLPPLPEQLRIVARIEELFSRLDAGVAALRHAKAQLKRYRQSVLAAAVTGQLTQAWREQHADTEPAEDLLKRILKQRREQWNGRGKYTEPVLPDDSSVYVLPTSWSLATIDQLQSRVQYGSSTKTDSDDDGVPVLRMGNILEGALIWDSLKFLPCDHSEFPELLLESGDLLFNRTNSPELVGKTAVFRSQRNPCSFASYLIRVRFLGGIFPEFVAAFINSHFGRAWIKSVVSQQVGQANVNGTKLRGVTLPLPPLAEQHQIVAEVEARTTGIDHLEAELDRQITRSNRLRQSTLASAFRGAL
jgi:type I restriction enzyme S subunit